MSTGGKRIILTRKGRKVAAIVSLDDLTAIEEIENKIDLEAVKKSNENVKRYGTISWREVKRKLKI